MTVASVLTVLADHPVLVLFLVTGIGAAIGRIRLWGMSLGAVAVLFTMIALTAWGVSQGVTIEVPSYVGDFGLVLFGLRRNISWRILLAWCRRARTPP